MESSCLPFSALPHTTRLFLDFLHHFEKVRQFYSRPPLGRDWLSAEAAALRYDQSRRERVAAVLDRQNRSWGASQETLHSIARFRAGASAIVTGQQVALFGGPLFAIYKALSAIKLANEASRAGCECISVFWLATEDHDLEEVNNVNLLTSDGSLAPYRTSSRGTKDAPISAVQLGPDIEGLVEHAVSALGDSEVGDFLRESYRQGDTLGSAFGKLFSRLFRHSGVILVDGSDRELHAIAEPVYRAAIMAAPDLEATLRHRSKQLEAAGYHAQVKVAPSSTLLFGLRDGARVPLHRGSATFAIGDERIPTDELLRRISTAPDQFSANVLLRPVVQDYLLPTLVYVGGPAEVAYFAQAAVVYEELLGRVTPILPRFSATLVEPRIKRLLDRYGLRLIDTFHGIEHLRVLLAERALPGDINASFDQVTRSVDTSLAELDLSLERLDRTLLDAAQRAGSKMRYQIERLRERAARALLRQNEEQARHADALITSLYPGKELQERVIGGVSFLTRYGTQFLLRLYDVAQTCCPDHQVIYLEP